MAATVRIRPETHDKLQQLAKESGQPMLAILDEAIESLRRHWVLRETNQAYETLRRTPKAWKDTLAERAAWDETLSDGLED